MKARADRDILCAAALALLCALPLCAARLKGLTPFWGDLTYIHYPWRVFDAQVLQAGRLPLWDPFLYFGMPAAATMQDSLYFPGSVPFFLFRFVDGLLLFHLAFYALSAALAFLWLRSCGFKRSAAAGGAGLLALGGVWLENQPFLNHLGVLALMPGILLLARRGAALALALCAAFLAGYPPFFVGSAAAAVILAWVFSIKGQRRAIFSGWLSAGAWAAALSGVLLLPAVELVGLSRRSGGVGLEEALQFGFSPRDLLQWVSPWVVDSFDPAVEWWKSCFVGFCGLALAAWGFLGFRRARAAAVGLWLGAVVVLILGGTNPVSAFLWRNVPALRFVRYPGNFSYLAVPVLSLLGAAGLQDLSPAARALAAAAVLLELSLASAGTFPLAPSSLFSSEGPLARRLQAELGSGRYLLSPLALGAGQGSNDFDWKHRLYGLTNAPYRLRAAGNFGEPLVPRTSYAVMDRMFSAKTADEAAAYFAWTDVRFLMTPRRLPPARQLEDRGPTLWQVYAYKGPAAPALWLNEREGAALPEDLPAAAPPAAGRALALSRPREDRWSVSGETDEPGWAYAAEPGYPGWRTKLTTERGEGEAVSLPALGAFQKVHVPAGRWRLDFRYEPDSFRRGLWLAALAWLFLGARLLKHAEVP